MNHADNRFHVGDRVRIRAGASLVVLVPGDPSLRGSLEVVGFTGHMNRTVLARSTDPAGSELIAVGAVDLFLAPVYESLG